MEPLLRMQLEKTPSQVEIDTYQDYLTVFSSCIRNSFVVNYSPVLNSDPSRNSVKSVLTFTSLKICFMSQQQF